MFIQFKINQASYKKQCYFIIRNEVKKVEEASIKVPCPTQEKKGKSIVTDSKPARSTKGKKKPPFSGGSDSLFDIASFLYAGLKVERRQGQLDMIQSLCETCERAERRLMSLEGRRELEQTGHMPVEVRFGQIPTGTGKSMAVILTALSAWLKWGLNSVVATHTHVLQDQLMGKDFPFIKNRLEGLLGADTLARWRAVLVKGMENYPCRLKMESLYSAALSTPGRTLLVNGRGTETDVSIVMAGRIDEIRDSLKNKRFELSEDDILFPLIRSDMSGCTGENCPYMNSCQYFTLMRIKSPFIVTNHAYLLSSVRSISERVASGEEELPGMSVSQQNPMEEEGEEGKGKKKMLSPFRSADLYFFDEAHHLMGYRALGKTVQSVSLREMNKLMSFAIPGNRLELFDSERKFRSQFFDLARWTVMKDGGEYPEETMNDLAARWKDSSGSVTGTCGDAIRSAQSFAMEQAALVRSFKEAEGSIIPGQGMRKTVSEDGARIILDGEANLLDDMKSALPLLRSVFCFSGTLFTKSDSSDSPDGEAFSAETGLVPTMPSFSAPSPFTFDSVRVWVPENAPLGQVNISLPKDKKKDDTAPKNKREKEREHDEFVERFCRTYIPPYLKEDLGGVLVLCSSKARMDKIAAAVAAKVEQSGMPRWLVMKQGERAKKHLAKSFVKASRSAVLFGSSSFREGFDVRGRQLTWVIIDRLPFPVPGSEDMRRIQELKRWGYIRNEFSHTVDIMKFHLEQSIGRLIRTERDWGTITLLDNRVLTTGKGWGCDNCFPVSMDKWYLDLPTEDEWINMCFDLEESFSDTLRERDTILAKKGEWDSSGNEPEAFTRMKKLLSEKQPPG